MDKNCRMRHPYIHWSCWDYRKTTREAMCPPMTPRTMQSSSISYKEKERRRQHTARSLKWKRSINLTAFVAYKKCRNTGFVLHAVTAICKSCHLKSTGRLRCTPCWTPSVGLQVVWSLAALTRLRAIKRNVETIFRN